MSASGTAHSPILLDDDDDDDSDRGNCSSLSLSQYNNIHVRSDFSGHQ